MKALIGLALVLISTDAVAQERWQYAGDGNEAEYGIFLDTATLERRGDYANAWFEYRYTGKNKGARDSTLLRINCMRRTMSVQSVAEYGPTGKYLRGHTGASPEVPAVPRSVGEMLWGAACPEEAKPQGTQDVVELAQRLRSEDPNYDQKISQFGPTIRSVERLFPPTLWGSVLELEYRKLPDPIRENP
ncbi:surface-adhesin E family protein [Lelliottia jeotgali]